MSLDDHEVWRDAQCMGEGPYKAKPAREDDSLWWYVVGGDGKTNILRFKKGGRFTTEDNAKRLADRWNGKR